MQAAYAIALVGLLAFAAPAANARSLKQDSSALTDADILNFALNLECLESQFYSCAVYGQPLSAELTGDGPAPIGCQSANFTNDDVYNIAMGVANDEIAHVKYLRTALGNSSVQCPLVNIGSAFSDAANAVLNTTLSPAFSPYVNDLFFLHGAFIFEDAGVTAYKGALASFQSKDIMTAAAGEYLSRAYVQQLRMSGFCMLTQLVHLGIACFVTAASLVHLHKLSNDISCLQESWQLRPTMRVTSVLLSLRTAMS